MEQSYQLDQKDYLQFNHFIITSDRRFLAQRILRVLLFPLVIAFELYQYGVPMPLYLALVAAGLAAWLVLMQIGIRRAVIAAVKVRVGSIGLFTTSIDTAGIHVEGPVTDTRVRWSKIISITESPQHLLFLLGPAFGFMIPKASFRDPEHARQFLETARAYQAGTLPLDAPVSTSGAWPPPPQRLR
ncbi:hypothetical protein CCAX7_56850 [Capsulimonas corticalis]|uniref:YcxB-like C-terminal domain-containing protein n=1 Tax=Capsulimonas corticalis TaxID=2219043 RepID=A0A402D0J5_9BACT|nr:YcxB family protein [Capsulimonas corticalis]BDI33634.1 hypothetical protein CCAX7_56850 [Capsulimonas corticalis]